MNFQLYLSHFHLHPKKKKKEEEMVDERLYEMVDEKV